MPLCVLVHNIVPLKVKNERKKCVHVLLLVNKKDKIEKLLLLIT